MKYWYELSEECWIYVEACIHDVATPCTVDPARCCLADHSAGLRALAERLADDPEPF